MRSSTFQVRTTAREQILIITGKVEDVLLQLAPEGEGICTLFTPHTTAALTINENADPDVPADLTAALRKLVPDVTFQHFEGNSDAHFLASLIGPSVVAPYERASLSLGRWQGIYFVELDGPRTREVRVYLS